MIKIKQFEKEKSLLLINCRQLIDMHHVMIWCDEWKFLFYGLKENRESEISDEDKLHRYMNFKTMSLLCLQFKSE